MRLPGENQKDDQDSGSRDRDLHRSASDASHDRLRHKQLPSYRDRRNPGLQVPVVSDPKHASEP
jgi:hypothetical protein